MLGARKCLTGQNALMRGHTLAFDLLWHSTISTISQTQTEMDKSEQSATKVQLQSCGEWVKFDWWCWKNWMCAVSSGVACSHCSSVFSWISWINEKKNQPLGQLSHPGASVRFLTCAKNWHQDWNNVKMLCTGGLWSCLGPLGACVSTAGLAPLSDVLIASSRFDRSLSGVSIVMSPRKAANRKYHNKGNEKGLKHGWSWGWVVF